MKAKYTFEIMDLDDGLVAVPIGENSVQFRGVLKVNDTAATILKLLERETTEAQIVEKLMEQYSGDVKQIASYVHDYIEKLQSEDLVED